MKANGSQRRTTDEVMFQIKSIVSPKRQTASRHYTQQESLVTSSGSPSLGLSQSVHLLLQQGEEVAGGRRGQWWG